MPEESATNEAMPAIDSSAVADELARLLFRNAPLVVAPSILVGGLVFGVLFPHVDVVMLLAWGAAVAITVVLRIFLIVGYWRAGPPPGGGARWANSYSVATLVAGAVWGLLPVLFLAPAPPEVFLGITMTLVGIAAGSMGLYTSWPAAYVAFTTPVLLSLSVCILLQGEDFVLLGMMGFAAYVVYLGIALLAYSRLREGVRIQFRNRELAERLDAEKARAERESHAKSELLAGISHDLRQPLQSVHLYTDMLRQQSVSQTAEDITDKINHSLWNVTCMVNQLLDLSRMEAGGVEVNMQAVELESLAERLYGQFMLRADQKGIELEVDCPPLHGWADPVLLTRVLDNLVANALRYTEEGDVCVVFSAVDEQIEIDVLDSGPGIPAEQQERIFDAFYQLEDGAKTANEGVGLGLAIVRRLCALMDIDIQIMSTEAGGTRVRLRLAAAENPQVSTSEVVPGGQGSSLFDRRIMVVEKDTTVRAAIEETLISRGCRVAGFAATEPALASFDSDDPPELIIAGAGVFRDRDGLELVEVLRRHAGHTLPVVLISSGVEEIDLGEAVGGACEVLRKPVDAASLLASMTRAIEYTSA